MDPTTDEAILPPERQTFSTADYVVFSLMLCISAGIGVYHALKARKNINNEEFFMGGRNLGLFPVTMSLVATLLSAITVLGIPAEVYVNGIQVWVMALACALAIALSTWIFLPVFYNMKLTSVNQYLELRFNSKLVRSVTAIFFLFKVWLYLGVVLYAPAVALKSVTQLSVWASVLIVGLVCTFYTAVGGMRAVVWTDAVQVGIMLAGMLAVVVKGCIELGGIGNMFEINREGGRTEFFNFEIEPRSSRTFFNLFFGIFVAYLGGYGVNQMEVQRYCTLKTQRQATVSMLLNIPFIVFVLFLACMCGLVVYATYHGCDPKSSGLISRYDEILPFFVIEHLNILPGIPGLFVACVFSASLSTLSSGLNAISAVIWEDYLKGYCNIGPRWEIYITKGLAVFAGLVTIGVAFLSENFTSVVQASIALAGCQVGPVTGVFILGFLFPFANWKGALSGLLSGLAFAFWITGGYLVYGGKKFSLPFNNENCPQNVEIVTLNKTLNYDNESGLIYLYQTSSFLVPLFGMIVTVGIGIVVSLICSDGTQDDLDDQLLTPCVRRLWLRSKRRNSSATEDGMVDFVKESSI